MNQPLTAQYLEQLQRGIEDGQTIRILPSVHEIRNVLLIAPGGSGIAAQTAQSLVVNEMPVPIIWTHTYDLPGFVNAHTLVISIADHETTKSPLDLWTQLAESKATVACLTNSQLTIPIRTVVPLSIPTEFNSQFSTIGYIITQLLYLLKHYQLISDTFVARIQAAMELIDKREYFMQDGAENLALGLKSKWPVLYGDAKIVAALRWFQYQLNRVSKQQAHVNVFPEITYAEIQSWKHPAHLLQEAMVVMVSTKFDSPHTKQQMDNVRTIVYPQSGGISEVTLSYGESLLEQILYGIHLFDWTAFFLARENGGF